MLKVIVKTSFTTTFHWGKPSLYQRPHGSSEVWDNWVDGLNLFEMGGKQEMGEGRGVLVLHQLFDSWFIMYILQSNALSNQKPSLWKNL